MAYSITNTDGSININIADQSIDSTFSLNLIGPNAVNYGDDIARNTIRQLENFASSTAPNPTTKLIGQLWYDKGESVLRLWDGTAWTRLRTRLLNAQPTGTGIEADRAGDLYFNTVNNQAYIYDGSNWKLQNYAGEVSSKFKDVDAIGEPQTAYGTKYKTVYLKDSGNISRAVAAIVSSNDSSQSLYKGATNGETIMAIFSDVAFTIGNFNSESEGTDVNYYPELAASGGIGTSIVKGMNLRSDYAQTSVPLAELATTATTANTLLSAEAGTGIQSAASQLPGGAGSGQYIYSSLLDVLPSATNTRKVGDEDFVYAEGHFTETRIGNKNSASSGIVKFVTPNVRVGTDTDSASASAGYPAKELHVVDLTVSGNVAFESGVQNLGTLSNPLENLYANTTVVLGGASGQVTINNFGFPPASTPSDNQALTYDSATGNIDFTSVALSTRQMIAGAGLTGGGDLSGDRTFDVGAGADIIVSADSIAVDSTTTATVNKIVKRDASGNINALGASITGNVTGTYFIGTATQAQYADLAENYLADQEYEAGTVVKIGGDFEITQTTNHADVDVFGVISTEPAYLMNSEAQGLPVALQGRVPVKVLGKIKKGERIVSSDEPGVAWALGSDEYDARAIIGRSLQDKEDGGLGIIEVVIGVK